MGGKRIRICILTKCNGHITNFHALGWGQDQGIIYKRKLSCCGGLKNGVPISPICAMNFFHHRLQLVSLLVRKIQL